MTVDQSETLLHQAASNNDVGGDGDDDDDDDDVHTIGLDEFLTLYAQQSATRDKDEEIRQAFQLFDLESRGFITVADLRRVVHEVGERFSDAQLEEMVQLASNGDGIVTRDAFAQLMSGL